ncbi:type II secretion system protein [Thalassotalea eurytherma]|uniref:Prepilin-type N-terminal cleavage/methylation domain-containing protein n=1 Tax=Thalassotalea eurytherma TaxID=1144278 RepID=A0ABQ6GXD0_9GAMM|nr:type II secretion system protein [Thalassotalea eurytherma]GLX80603.1 hypothetical protein theurythT_00550 [Thalassotalea eurytherma]
MRNGFTLIELVIVIVILGILAATAAPKFIDLTSDATAAKVENMAGNLSSGLNLVLMKKEIQNATTTVELDGDDIVLLGGYPQASAPQVRLWIDTNFPVTTWTPDWYTVPCTGSEFCVLGNRPSGETPTFPGLSTGTKLFIWPEGYVLDACFAYYGNPNNGDEPVTGAVTSGC